MTSKSKSNHQTIHKLRQYVKNYVMTPKLSQNVCHDANSTSKSVS